MILHQRFVGVVLWLIRSLREDNYFDMHSQINMWPNTVKSESFASVLLSHHTLVTSFQGGKYAFLTLYAKIKFSKIPYLQYGNALQ